MLTAYLSVCLLWLGALEGTKSSSVICYEKFGGPGDPTNSTVCDRGCYVAYERITGQQNGCIDDRMEYLIGFIPDGHSCCTHAALSLTVCECHEDHCNWYPDSVNGGPFYESCDLSLMPLPTVPTTNLASRPTTTTAATTTTSGSVPSSTASASTSRSTTTASITGTNTETTKEPSSTVRSRPSSTNSPMTSDKTDDASFQITGKWKPPKRGFSLSGASVFNLPSPLFLFAMSLALAWVW